jgi:hypothetical protein
LGYCLETRTYCCNQNEYVDCCDLSVESNIVVDLPVASMVAVTTSLAGSIYTTVLPTLTSIAPFPSNGTRTPIPTNGGGSTGGVRASVSAGAGVGIGIGGAVALFALLVLAYFFWRRMGARRRRVYAADPVMEPTHEREKEAAELHQQPLAEVHGLDRRQELYGNIYISELQEIR